MELLEAWNLIEWIIRLLFIEMGVLAGLLVKDKIELPSTVMDDSNPHPKKTLRLGSMSQFIVGFAASFAFQVAGIDLLMCWIYATSLGTVVNVGGRIFAGRLKESEVKKALKTAMTKMIELEELQSKETEKVEMHLDRALREAKAEKLGEIKEELAKTIDYPFKNGYRKLSDAMKEREKILAASYEFSPIPTIFANRDGQTIAVNRAMLQISGMDRKTNLEINLLKLKDKKLVGHVKDGLHGKSAEYAVHYQTQHSDGRIIPAHFLISPMKEEGKVVGIMLTMVPLAPFFYEGDTCQKCGRIGKDCLGKSLMSEEELSRQKSSTAMTIAQAQAIVRRQMLGKKGVKNMNS